MKLIWKLICQDCKHQFESQKTGQPCPKCKQGYAITLKEYETLRRVRDTFRAMGG